jgi:hypothetical protein
MPRLEFRLHGVRDVIDLLFMTTYPIQRSTEHALYVVNTFYSTMCMAVLGWCQWGAIPPPLSPQPRREAGEREREGGSTTAGRERALSPRSRPRWQAVGGR